VIVHNFALSMESVFGRESMPDFTRDFDRIDDRVLQTFGLSKTMLSGAGQGETYAADALNRDLITQLLSTFQRRIKRFFRDRALIVAEAQEHYDYDERNGKRYPIMEEILVVDPETGEQRIEEQPKLLVPDLNIRAMNMQDDTLYRQLIEALRESGVPISMETRLVNIPVDLEDEMEKSRQEAVRLAVENQLTRQETYRALKEQGLPIPDDLTADFEPKAATPSGEATDDGAEPLPQIGFDQPGVQNAIAPTQEGLAEGAAEAEGSPDGSSDTLSESASGHLRGEDDVRALPRNVLRQRQRPPESDEMRAGMPRPVAASKESDGEDEDDARGLEAPWSFGKRRTAGIVPDVPLDEQLPPDDDDGITVTE
jgi:hypothetical protein